MEARQTLRGSGVPKGLVIALAACAAVAVAMGASVIAKDMSSASSAGTTTFHAAPGTVLRQDNPAVGAPLLDRGADRGSAAPAAPTGRSTRGPSIQARSNEPRAGGPQ